MLRVTVELLPFGDESAKKTLTTFDIANNGTGNLNLDYGNYDVRLDYLDRWYRNVVTDHPRELPVLQLVYQALSGLNKKGEI